MKIAMCRAYLTDAQIQIHVLTAAVAQHCLSIINHLSVCVCVWQPGRIMANAHSEFPIKSAQTALFVWRLLLFLLLLPLLFGIFLYSFLVHFPDGIDVLCQRHFDGFCKLLMETCWRKTKKKKKGKKQKANEKASAENI